LKTANRPFYLANAGETFLSASGVLIDSLHGLVLTSGSLVAPFCVKTNSNSNSSTNKVQLPQSQYSQLSSSTILQQQNQPQQQQQSSASQQQQQPLIEELIKGVEIEYLYGNDSKRSSRKLKFICFIYNYAIDKCTCVYGCITCNI